MTACAALGVGALPVPNPLFGVRLWGLPARNETVALAIAYAGMALLVVAWLQIARGLWGADGPLPAGVRTQLTRTALTWAVPLAMAPPLFSRDVYSYLAQGAMLARGLDPSVSGPAALGISDPLVRSVPTLWRDSPAPYGPLFLAMAHGVARVTGEDIVLGVLAHRLLALAGIAAAAWALPRLAETIGVDGGRALWLGMAHPLALFHLVSGAHNDAVMIGLMLAGLRLGLRGRGRILDAGFLGGAAVVVAASAVKLPALLALGFLGMQYAHRRGPSARSVGAVTAALAAVVVVVYLGLAWTTGSGWGWVQALGVPSDAVAWMSPVTDLGYLLAAVSDQPATVLSVVRIGGLVAGATACVWLLARVLHGRLDGVTGLALAMVVGVSLGPVVQPWYLLWATVPLAASPATARRRQLLAGSAVLALIAVPTGADFRFHLYQLPTAIAGAAVIFAAAVWALDRSVAGSPDPHRVDTDPLLAPVPSGTTGRGSRRRPGPHRGRR